MLKCLDEQGNDAVGSRGPIALFVLFQGLNGLTLRGIILFQSPDLRVELV